MALMQKIRFFILIYLIAFQINGFGALTAPSQELALRSLGPSGPDWQAVMPILKNKLERWLRESKGTAFTISDLAEQALENSESSEIRLEAAAQEAAPLLTQIENDLSHHLWDSFKTHLPLLSERTKHLPLAGIGKQKLLLYESLYFLITNNPKKAKETLKACLYFNPRLELPVSEWEMEAEIPQFSRLLQWRDEFLKNERSQAIVTVKPVPSNATVKINGFNQVENTINLPSSQTYRVDISMPGYLSERFSLTTRNLGKQVFTPHLKKSGENKLEKPTVFIDRNGNQINFYLFHPDKGLVLAPTKNQIALSDLMERPLQTDVPLVREDFVAFFENRTSASAASSPTNQIIKTENSIEWYQNWKWWGAIAVVSGVILVTLISRNSHEDPVRAGQVGIRF